MVGAQHINHWKLFKKKRKRTLLENLAVKDMILLDRLNWWEVLQKDIRMKKIWQQRSPSWLDCSDQNDKKIGIREVKNETSRFVYRKLNMAILQ